MSSTKLFKILRLNDLEKDSWGKEQLLAELLEVEVLDFNGQKKALIPYSDEGTLFIFNTKSRIAQSLLNFPEQLISLDMGEYQENEISINTDKGVNDESEKRTVYYELDAIPTIWYPKSSLGKENIKTDAEQNSLNINIDKCILMHNTDRYFTCIFRHIIHTQYEAKGINSKNQLHQIYNEFDDVSAFILMESANEYVNDFVNIIDHITYHRYQREYDILLNHANGYAHVISDYVSFRPELRDFLLLKLGDTKPHFFKFYQKCMLKGYEIACRRIEENLESSNHFNHEFVNTSNSSVLKIFPTPLGFSEKDYLVGLAHKKQIDNYLDDYLVDFGIRRLVEQDLIRKLGTKYIYQIEGKKGLYYYKRRTKGGEYAPFGEQDREVPIRALITQGQMNLTQIKI